MNKMVIIGVAGVLLLGGGGAGAMYAMGMLPGAEAAEEEAAAEEDVAEVMEDGVYVRIDNLSIPVIVGRRVRHSILLSITLQVPNSRAKTDVMAVLPRLRDALLRELFTRPIQEDSTTGAIDLDDLKRRLLSTSQSIAGPDDVNDVLVMKAVRMG